MKLKYDIFDDTYTHIIIITELDIYVPLYIHMLSTNLHILTYNMFINNDDCYFVTPYNNKK